MKIHGIGWDMLKNGNFSEQLIGKNHAKNSYQKHACPASHQICSWRNEMDKIKHEGCPM